MDENSKDTVWWTSDEYKNDNHPASQEAWEAVKEIAKKELSDKRLFVVDAFCGANKDTLVWQSVSSLRLLGRHTCNKHVHPAYRRRTEKTSEPDLRS